ncbi:DNA excision repair protein ERCC-1 [Cryptococcus neoformans C23]|uniref:DNA excision repair protein ERCC-1 n=1 Tax=Cryptococcus neoformans (strain H99 / ATCC 208821 / CBS 10515 / FGSC 9487) TaxID=235443 RepID=J9VRZ3_CRYN9|nr:DNA excision repair protein ERCC-1 [Cryptococcus neoformans var. grubii H99]XP_012050585.1 DNA excision repair protein ERCC-1, variant [Cryptococcus neoformans var. grubii H99]AUB26071.1 DNA excision repair protein ERCC-1 [Cryptococcus neoformans var. grubii]OWZ30597.1 DNA excision repair protein ERCC-1 [Cryptococcus neoformans var. grubii AD2-60a]OWZ42370.1 DNA excision repair protein ERCC-1 [Cryptococcus neoformans var. grubii C23]OXC83728.1 DNA excision repair protein ERCC-1 [Cryptococcu|eukprot:XP_012050584.1 DNA excision repair protein ERCC-1 [Cryptococcus neoformans var. grubii H99]
MTEQNRSSSSNGGSIEPSMAPPVFQTASSVLRSTAAQASPAASASTRSLRDASGGQPSLSTSTSAPSSSALGSSSNTAVGTGGTLINTSQTSRPINRPAASKSSIIYNAVQRRNPVLSAIRNVGIEVGDIVADYQVGAHNGVLFLSLKYHRLHPEYIHQRIEKLKNMYNFRVILLLCDVNEHHQSLRELTKIAIINEFTIFVAWSNEEVAQYLVTFKQFEHKSADTLKERVQQTYHDQLAHVLTSGKKVNKTDADNLAAEFGSFEAISRKSAKSLSNVKGLGATKVTSLIDAFTKPFLVGGLRRPERKKTAQEKQADEEAAAFADGDMADPTESLELAVGNYDANERHERQVTDEVKGGDMVSGQVWHDPLDDEDDDKVAGEEPISKRARIDSPI